MLAGLLALLPVTWKNLSLQLILMSGQIEQEQGHKCHFVVDQTAVIKLLNEKTLLDLTSIQFCSDFLFGPNHIRIRYYVEFNS